MPQSQTEMEPESRRIFLFVLLKWQSFMLARVVVIEGAAAVQHDIRSGLGDRAELLSVPTTIFAWVIRDWIRYIFISRASRN